MKLFFLPLMAVTALLAADAEKPAPKPIPFSNEQKLQIQLIQEKQKNLQMACYVQNKQATDDLQQETVAFYTDICKSAGLEPKQEKCAYDLNAFMVGTPAAIAEIPKAARPEAAKK